MPIQFSLPGFEEDAAPAEPSHSSTAKPKPTGARAPYSLFFAIFPPTEEARAIARQCTHLGRERGLESKPLSAHRLHVTLHDLGGYTVVPHHLVNAALQAGYALAEPLFEVVRQALSPMARVTIHAGGAGAGQAAKICNNMVLGVSMLGVCEAFGLAEKLGLAPERFFEIASQSSISMVPSGRSAMICTVQPCSPDTFIRTRR